MGCRAARSKGCVSLAGGYHWQHNMGLAGLRLGFAIGHPGVVDRVGRVTGPYDVNSLAVAAAFAALEDQAYTNAYVAKVLRARDWIVSEMTRSRVVFHCDGGSCCAAQAT